MAESKARNTDPRYSKLTIGVCPDQWGVWFPQDEKQIDWDVALDEMADGGLLGHGDGAVRLLPDRARRGSRRRWTSAASASSPAPAGASCTRPRPGPTPRSSSARSARPTRPSGAEYVVHLPPMFRDEKTGAYTDDRVLSTEAWNLYIRNADRLGRIMKEDYGLKMVLHPHGDSHIETPDDIDRIFQATDPEYVGFCLDTGHIVYGDGDPMELCRKYPERISYVHIKAMDPVLGQAGPRRGLAVRQGRARRLLGRPRPPACPTCTTSSRRSPTSTRSSTSSASRTCTAATSPPRCPTPSRPASTSPRSASALALRGHDSDRPHRHDRPRRHGAGAHRPHPHRHRRRAASSPSATSTRRSATEVAERIGGVALRRPRPSSSRAPTSTP